MESRLCTALDIGTSKVAVVVGDINEQITIQAVGTAPCYGLKNGVVTDIEETAKAIRHAVEEAQTVSESRIRIDQLYVGVSGEHVRSYNSRGTASIRGLEVTESDKERAIDAARAIGIPDKQLVLNVMTSDYDIDGQAGIKEPLQMSGKLLNVNVHLVTGSKYAVRNIDKCVKQCGLEMMETVLEQIASSMAVLTEGERELGVCLVDIGGGTSDIAVYRGGCIIHSEVIPLAGDHVTRDIAVTLHAQKKVAEDIKLKYGSCEPEKVIDESMISVPGVASRPAQKFKRSFLNQIIVGRYEELFRLFHERLAVANMTELAVSGFVLTGGSSKMEGLVHLAEEIFNAPTRLGRPKEGITGLVDLVESPIYATAVGLLHYAKKYSDGSRLKVGRLSSYRRFFPWLDSHRPKYFWSDNQ